tara:strand:- start:718 stop:966 length:249 start_codon:yes stop_codon:yes gene_type:complete
VWLIITPPFLVWISRLLLSTFTARIDVTCTLMNNSVAVMGCLGDVFARVAYNNYYDDEGGNNRGFLVLFGLFQGIFDIHDFF